MISNARLQVALAAVDDALLATLPEESDCIHVFSPRFERKMQQVLRRAAHPGARKMLLRAACVLLVLSALFGCLVAFNPAVRAAVMGWLRQWMGDFFVYTTEIERTVGNIPTYTLTNLPDDYYLIDFNVSDCQGTYIYTNNQSIINFNYTSKAEETALLLKYEGMNPKSVMINNHIANIYLPSNSQQNKCIIWTDPEYTILLSISADCSDEELVTLAKSVVRTYTKK